jgi:hypothetical protein
MKIVFMISRVERVESSIVSVYVDGVAYETYEEAEAAIRLVLEPGHLYQIEKVFSKS